MKSHTSSATRPKGTIDFLPRPTSAESGLFDSEQKTQVEQLFRDTVRRYGFREIVTPVFEHSELFTKSAGDSSDIVTKEMYSFTDRADRQLVLRPEGTPGVIRAVLSAGIRLPARLFYVGPFFRYSRPQKGRYRQFHQLGVEALGEASPLADAELIRLGQEFYRSVGILDCTTAINSIGCRLCRPLFRDHLRAFLLERQQDFCDDCRRRIELNPLRVYDCKLASCQAALDKAPRPIGHLCPECRGHFEAVLEDLRRSNTAFSINDRLVRGLDYYSRTTFEYTSPALGAQDSLGGGGRYDYLIGDMGGQNEPAVGFALGLERTLLAANSRLQSTDTTRQPLVFVVWFSDNEFPIARDLAEQLRQADVPARLDYEALSTGTANPLRHQLKAADVAAARLAVIVAPEELKGGVYSLKDLATGEQHRVPGADLVSCIRGLLGTDRP